MVPPLILLVDVLAHLANSEASYWPLIFVFLDVPQDFVQRVLLLGVDPLIWMVLIDLSQKDTVILEVLALLFFLGLSLESFL